MYTHIPLSSVHRGPRSNDIPVAMSIPRTQVLVCNFILQQKKPGLLRKMANCRPGIRNIKHEPGATCSGISTYSKMKMMAVCQSNRAAN